MRAILVLLALIVLGAIVAIMTGYLNISQTSEAVLPSVHVDGGRAPSFEVDTADVDVGTTNTTVDVPQVSTEKKTVELPTVSVKKPD
jgi:hypothetical protein